MPNCSSCGGHVSERYHRVLADRNGVVYCPTCQTTRNRDVLNGMDGFHYAAP